jgi:hypothetical protein
MELQFHEDLEMDTDAKKLAKRLGDNARDRARAIIVKAGHVDTGRLTSNALHVKVSGSDRKALATIIPPRERLIWLSKEERLGRLWISVNGDAVHEEMQEWLKTAFK